MILAQVESLAQEAGCGFARSLSFICGCARPLLFVAVREFFLQCARSVSAIIPPLERFQSAYAVHREDACNLKCINLYAKSARLRCRGILRLCCWQLAAGERELLL